MPARKPRKKRGPATLLVNAAAARQHGMTIPERRVLVVDHKKFTKLDQMRIRTPFEKGYEVWDRYHSAILDALRNHGKSVGSNDEADFYHSGDWFHELGDGFAFRTTTALSIPLLHQLQVVVQQHHPDARLSLAGEMGTPMCGLEVLVTSSAIYAAWYKRTLETCRRKLRKIGIRIL
jgi:hypothetical protein